jgi:hypothetical protein
MGPGRQDVGEGWHDVGGRRLNADGWLQDPRICPQDAGLCSHDMVACLQDAGACQGGGGTRAHDGRGCSRDMGVDAAGTDGCPHGGAAGRADFLIFFFNSRWRFGKMVGDGPVCRSKTWPAQLQPSAPMKLPVLTSKNDLMPLSAHVGGVFRRLRQALRLSQRKVASLSGVARSDISLFERGKQRIYLDTFERLCVPLGRRPVLLLVETEELAY